MSVSFFPFLKKLFILLSLPLLFLSACSQPLSVLNVSNTPHVAWTAPIGGTDWGYADEFPVVANGVVYYNSDKLYALDAATGQQKWAVAIGNSHGSDTTGSSISSNRPVVANGILYIVGDKLYVLDAATGQQKWIAPLSDPPVPANGPSSPAIANGMAYVAFPGDHKLYAFSL